MKIEEKAGEFFVTDFNELESYKIASKIEKDSIDFYLGLLDHAKIAAIKDKLEFLVQEERKHLKFFEECLFKIRQSIEDGFEEDDLLNYMDYGIFSKFENADKITSGLNDAQKALWLGLVIEDRSIRFYQACAKCVSSPNTKKELNNIIQEEKRHKDILKDLLNGF